MSKSEKKQYTYADSGVDRELRAKSKESLTLLKATFNLSKYGEVIHLPYGNLLPFGGKFLDIVIEGVGTKVLIAQLAEKYDTIGIDGVAMAVNDVIRSGARPIVLVDNIHAHTSDPSLIKALLKGIAEGASYADCPVISGEIGDVAEIISGLYRGKGFDLVIACVGELPASQIIRGDNVEAGDVIIGLRSSGLHSNGITLARKVLLKKWGGLFEAFQIPDQFDRPIINEILEPTKIYVQPFLEVSKYVKAAVHITGDAYLKFNKIMKLNPRIGVEITNFKPHTIFSLIQEASMQVRSPISNVEMLCTFNMGWGFAFIVAKDDVDSSLDILERENEEADVIGYVNNSGKIIVDYMGERLVLG